MSEQHSAAVDVASLERLVRVETKLDLVIESKTTAHAELVKDIADHEVRIRGLERVWWKSAGIAGVIAALFASGAGYLLKLVS